jgi:hypothetical protein
MYGHVLRSNAARFNSMEDLLDNMVLRGFSKVNDVNDIRSHAFSCYRHAHNAVKFRLEMKRAATSSDVVEMSRLWQHALNSQRIAVTVALPGRTMFVFDMPSCETAYNDRVRWPPGIAVAFVSPTRTGLQVSSETYVALPCTLASEDDLSSVMSSILNIITPGQAGSAPSQMECGLCLGELSSEAEMAIAKCDCCSLAVHFECILQWTNPSRPVPGYPSEKPCPQCRRPFFR